MSIFRICVFSPFLKQQKLGVGGEVWLLPADPARQAEQLGWFSFLTLVGFLPSQKVGEQEEEPWGRSLLVTEVSEGSCHTRVNRTGWWGGPEGQGV